jgi:hypothetical protein
MKRHQVLIMSRQGRPKLETNSKYECSNVQNRKAAAPVLVIGIWIIGYCFEFRASDFGF